MTQKTELDQKITVGEDSLLRVNDLHVSFVTRAGRVQAISGVSFEIKRGESFGLVGETGCGKSQTALAVMRLTPESGLIEQGQIWFNGRNLAENIGLEFKLVRKGRKGTRIVLKRNKSEMDHLNSKMAMIRGKEISMIFQEPMTSLNPVHTIGAQISEVLMLHSSQELANRVLSRTETAKASLLALIRYDLDRKNFTRVELQKQLKKLELENLTNQIWSIVNRKDIGPPEKIEKIAALSDRRLNAQTRKYLNSIKDNGGRDPFPYRVLNRIPVVEKSFIGVIKKEALDKAFELLSLVSMPNAKNVLIQYPHELSGGMRQRVMIAMAIAANPKLVIADEPTSALDVTVQAQILELLQNLKESIGTSLLFISHDMGVISEICNRVGVMYAGNIVEVAEVGELFENPKHPYTQGLLAAIPKYGGTDESLQTIKGDIPNLIDPPKGCRFIARCPFAFDKCTSEPPLIETSKNHAVLCWLYGENESHAS